MPSIKAGEVWLWRLSKWRCWGFPWPLSHCGQPNFSHLSCMINFLSRSLGRSISSKNETPQTYCLKVAHFRLLYELALFKLARIRLSLWTGTSMGGVETRVVNVLLVFCGAKLSRLNHRFKQVVPFCLFSSSQSHHYKLQDHQFVALY